MIIISYYLLFPLKIIAQIYFLNRTKRVVTVTKIITQPLIMIECLIFVLFFIFCKDYYGFRSAPYPDNKFIEIGADLTTNQLAMLNIIYVNQENIYRMDFLLAVMGFLIWLRFFFCFKVSQMFGPMFKIIFSMVQDLVKFLIIWIVILTMFSCVAILAFGELDNFSNMNKAF